MRQSLSDEVTLSADGNEGNKLANKENDAPPVSFTFTLSPTGSPTGGGSHRESQMARANKANGKSHLNNLLSVRRARNPPMTTEETLTLDDLDFIKTIGKCQRLLLLMSAFSYFLHSF